MSTREKDDDIKLNSIGICNKRLILMHLIYIEHIYYILTKN